MFFALLVAPKVFGTCERIPTTTKGAGEGFGHIATYVPRQLRSIVEGDIAVGWTSQARHCWKLTLAVRHIQCSSALVEGWSDID